MSISKRENREGNRTIANLQFLFLFFFVEYFNRLGKDFDTGKTGDYKGFKKSVSWPDKKFEDQAFFTKIPLWVSSQDLEMTMFCSFLKVTWYEDCKIV